jgi:hypothetical protein
MSDQPFYAPDRPIATRQPRPGEHLWSVQKDGRQFACELRDYGLRPNVSPSLPPQPGYGGGGPMELVVGSIAPPRAPQNRLPLNLAFAIDKPGRYSVRWTVVGERREVGPPPSRHDELLAQSNWLEFDVKAMKLSEREAWLRRLLTASPTDDAAYVGDYLPSLLAGAPDGRVARAMIDGTYSGVLSCAIVRSARCRPMRTSPPLRRCHLAG